MVVSWLFISGGCTGNESSRARELSRLRPDLSVEVGGIDAGHFGTQHSEPWKALPAESSDRP